MKRILPFLFVIVLLVSCIGNTPTTVTQPSPPTQTNPPASPTGTSTAASTQVQPTPEPTPRWYWVFEPATGRLLAVNQFGESRVIGTLPGTGIPTAYPVDAERAFLVTSDHQAYLLSLEDMQPINLPPYAGLGDEFWSVVAVYGRYLVYSYPTLQSVGTANNNTLAERGPLVLVDLETLSAKVIDEKVNRNAYTNSYYDLRPWAHRSEDGRFLRYLNGDLKGMELRELDLETGEVRTVYTARELHYTSQIFGSLTGDQWIFGKDGVFVDVDGTQVPINDNFYLYSPLHDGRTLWLNNFDCLDDCEINLIPLGEDGTESSYTLPWSSYTFHNPLVNRVAADGSLIFVGYSLSALPGTPAIVDEYPDFPQFEKVVFRLSPDGSSRLLGLYPALEYALNYDPVSPNGRYLVLRSVDQSTYFVYDTQADRSVGEIPYNPEMGNPVGRISFFENGFLAVNMQIDDKTNTYVDAYLMYSYLTGEPFTWSTDTEPYGTCLDILPDNTLVCDQFDYADNSSRLVLYTPETGETVTLLENVISLVFTP